MINWIRSILKNPVTLRDIGWKYAPPVLWVIPRHYFHLFVGISIILAFYGFYLYLLRIDNSRDIFLFYSSLVGIATGGLLILLSLAGSASSWRKDRELNRLPELILTGMDMKQLAHGKLFIGAMPIILSALFFTLNMLPGFLLSLWEIFWEAITVKSYWSTMRAIEDQWLNLVALPITLILCSVSFQVYASSVRLSFTRRFPIAAVLMHFFRKDTLMGIVIILALIFVTAMAIAFDLDDEFLLILLLSSILFTLIISLCDTLIEYRYSMHSIMYHYHLQVDELSF